MVLVPAVTQAAVVGVNNVNGMDQNPYPGAGSGGDVYYNAVTGKACGVNDPLREDGWGIFKIQSIGSWSTGSTLWSESVNNDEGVEIYGLYYGRVDTRIDNSSSGFGQVTISSQNVCFAIFANPVGTFADAGGVTQGSAGRTGFDQYTGITGGTLLLSGMVNALDDRTSFTYEFNVDKDGTSDVGRWSASILLTDGEWLDRFVGDYLSLANKLTPSVPADEAGNWVTRGSGSMNGAMATRFNDQDPVWITMNSWDMTTVYTDGHAPEPLTMSLLAAGGLAALLRRRR